MVAHTKGPWRVEEGATYAGPPMVIAESGTIIGGFMGSGTQTVAEDNANARLCAAAPDLLAACEAMMAAFDEPGNPVLYTGPMLAAIAKAKGETP